MLTTDGSVFVMAQFTINSVELDKVQPFKTCHISITRSTKTEHCFVLKLSNSQESLPKPIGLDNEYLFTYYDYHLNFGEYDLLFELGDNKIYHQRLIKLLAC